ncbi:MAG: hypothetical protein HY609_00750 [Deltaproteobacteria bacterium]|nr:hypothetical protein [Deltaproteobacteria bacterium]
MKFKALLLFLCLLLFRCGGKTMINKKHDVIATARAELQNLGYKEEHYRLTIDQCETRWKGIEDNFLKYNPDYKNVLSKKQFVVVCFDRILKPGEIIMGGSGFFLIDKKTNEVIVVVPMK